MRTSFVAGVMVLAAGCADRGPPSWNAGELTVREVSGSRIVVSWPESEGASAYVIRIDGRPAARLGPDVRSYAAAELEEATEHSITVEAHDEAGNASPVLRASATTLDTTAPAFAEGAALEIRQEPREPVIARSAGEEAPSAIVLRWPAASDNVGVTRYRVLRGDEELASVDSPATAARIETASDEVRFEVRALDAAGNESANGLVGTFRSRRLAIAQVEQLLLGAATPSGAFADVVGGDPVTSSAEDVLAQGGGVPRGGALPRGGLGLGIRASTVRGRATLGAIEGAGGAGAFDAALVERALSLRLSAIQRCYERALRSEPALAGGVRVRFTILEAGSIARVEVVDGVDPAVDACVLAVVRSLRFNPGPEGGSATYAASVALAPERRTDQ